MDALVDVARWEVNVDQTAFVAAVKNLRREAKENEHALRIQRFGQCPHFKDHFDPLSFIAGVFATTFTIGVVALIVQHLTR